MVKLVFQAKRSANCEAQLLVAIFHSSQCSVTCIGRPGRLASVFGLAYLVYHLNAAVIRGKRGNNNIRVVVVFTDDNGLNRD